MSNSQYALGHSESGVETSSPETADNAPIVKKKRYVAPQLTEPQGLLETTKFFFQAANGGSLLSHPDPNKRRYS